MSEGGFVEFYMTYWQPLVAALTLALPDGEDSRDVAQEAFVRAFAHWDRVEAHERPDAWLFLTALRAASKLRRRAVRSAASGEPSARASALDRQADLIALQQGLAALPPRQRAALLLRHYYGFTTREAAEALGCAEGTVKSMLARGRATLLALDAGGER